MYQSTDRKGYKKIRLTINDVGRNFLVHRLVAEAFIPNPENLPQINHKNSDKADNRPENLEWCTNSYNYHYGDRIKTFVNSYGVPVVQYTKDGRFIKEYEYASVAAKELGICVHNILACAHKYKRGKRGYEYTVRSAGGFVWRKKGEPF